MKKILFLLVLMFLYSCAWAQSADWKTCTLKASKVVTYQNGSKTNETKSNISITIDKPYNPCRQSDVLCRGERGFKFKRNFISMPHIPKFGKICHSL